MTTVKPGVTTYRSGDPITVTLRQVAAGMREAYRNAPSSEARTAVHRSAWQIALHVWPEATDDNTTLHARFLELCFGLERVADLAVSGETSRPPLREYDLNVITDRLRRAGELARGINEAAKP